MGEPVSVRADENERLRILFSSGDRDTELARPEAHSSKAEMHEPEGQGIPELWRTWHQVRVGDSGSGLPVYHKKLRYTRQKPRARSDRHKWELCARKYTVRNERAESGEPKKHCSSCIRPMLLALCGKRSTEETERRRDERTDHRGCVGGGAPEEKKLAWDKRTARVYDIRNAGRLHRYTVSDCLVHNCGYGGGVGALMRMSGGKGVPIPDDFEPNAPEDDRMDGYLAHLVKEWRKASPNIVKFWWDVDRMVKQTIKTGEPRKLHHGLGSFIRDGRLNLSLPSGRCLSYVSPSIGKNKFGGESIAHMGVDSTHPNWSKLETYGPKLVENIVQATARDCLAVSMLRLEAEGYDVVFHVHDECIIEKKIGEGSLEEVQEIMGRPIAWAPGLLLRADGYECDFYMKD